MTLILRQSRIHSYGCCTTRRIRKGTLIIEYVGEYLSYEQADDLYDDFENTYLFGLDGGKRIIDGFGVAAFVNHSCEPNCETDRTFCSPGRPLRASSAKARTKKPLPPPTTSQPRWKTSPPKAKKLPAMTW